MAGFIYLALLFVLTTASEVYQRNSNPCLNVECQNGGYCTAPADAPSCICPPAFFGPHCEFSLDPCFNYGCRNGGFCTAPADAPFCVCPKGFIGQKCELFGNLQCPANNSNSVCGGEFCSSDSQCPNGQICCNSTCGGFLCTPGIPVIEETPCRGGCPDGFTCEFRPQPCPPGRICPAVVLPVCVPEPKDPCGNCPKGQTCKPTGIVCVKEPCLEAFKCFPDAPAVCNLACIRGLVCQLVVPDCPKYSRKPCSRTPVPKCVPKPNELASCPKPAQILDYLCSQQSRRPQCDTDKDCDNSRKERCCPNQCNRRQCTVVPSL